MRRGETVEAVHRVDAVAVRGGETVAAAGDEHLVTFLRSSAKPLQALLLARARPELDDTLIAIACASHRAEPEQLTAVDRLLAAVPAGEDELECGSQDGRPAGARFHNCSGKHAGMLAVCRARGWPTEGYVGADHPLQQALAEEVAAVSEAAVATGVDGCGVLTFGMSLERMANAFARLEQVDSGPRIAGAMRAHARLIGGEGSLDSQLMLALPGWIAKIGAEGLICALAPDGTGVAFKCEDGAMRPLAPALAAFLPLLGHELAGFARVPVTGRRGEVVGEVVVS